MARRCENCLMWQSTDRVWGVCDYASSSGPDRLAAATMVRHGREIQADLETNFKFRCAAWQTPKKVVAP